MKSKIVYKGNEIEVPSFHARLLVNSNRATFPEPLSSRQPEGEEHQEEGDQGDEIQDEEEQKGTDDSVTEDSAPEPRQKRTYKRRDMQAEA